MAAGLGFKTFTTGEVLTAADTNGYLMQGVLVFASAAARDAAITSPQEGQFAYLKDTNVTTYYTGSAWTNLDTTGMVNPMTTTGDTIYSSSGSTPARLGIGSTGQVLTVAGGIPSWATPAGGGGKVLQVVCVAYTTAAFSSSTTFTHTGLSASITPSATSSKVLIIVTQNGVAKIAGNAASGFKIRLNRGTGGGTTIWNEDDVAYNNTSQTVHSAPITTSYLDAPATASSVTYETYMANAVAAASVQCQSGGVASIMTLLEIGA